MTHYIALAQLVRFSFLVYIVSQTNDLATGDLTTDDTTDDYLTTDATTDDYLTTDDTTDDYLTIDDLQKVP